MKSKIFYFLRKILRIERFEQLMDKSLGFKYLTPDYIADLENITVTKAQRKLENSVIDGFLKKKFLYYNIDLDLSIFVKPEQIGKTITVENLPQTPDSKEVFISPDSIRAVYVTA